MTPKPSRLPLLLGILLIIAAPVMLVTHFANVARSQGSQLESSGTVQSKERQDTAYVLNVLVPDAPKQDEVKTEEGDGEHSGTDEVKEELDNKVQEMMDSIRHSLVTTDNRSEEKEHVTERSEKELYTDALKRKTDADNEEEQVKEHPELNNVSLASVHVSKTDFDHYKKGDTVTVAYDLYDYTPTLVSAETKKKRKNENANWFLAAAGMIILGIVLVVRTRRQRSQQQDLDTLSTFPTTYSTMKKPKSTEIPGAPKGPF
jgi:hypothetical protein